MLRLSFCSDNHEEEIDDVVDCASDPWADHLWRGLRSASAVVAADHPARHCGHQLGDGTPSRLSDSYAPCPSRTGTARKIWTISARSSTARRTWSSARRLRGSSSRNPA